MFDNIYIQQRVQKAQSLRDLGINPYSNTTNKDTNIDEFFDINKDVENLENKRDENKIFTVCGRIKFIRIMGKATFIKIVDISGILQIYISRDNLQDGYYNNIFKKYFETGDIIEAAGFPFVTGKGELSLNASKITMLTKAISPLPEKFHGLQDKEQRYRQRYLDMIMNEDVKKIFQTRSKIISYTRQFFEQKGFLEVETPMMHPIAGGANAKPFVTFHNSLGVDRFLRIAPELYLKRLIVGGFEAVFEINRNFRNEGMDATHNPEFTSIEFYWAYKTYKDLIKLTIEYLEYLLDKLNLTKQIKYNDMVVDFSKFSQIPLLHSLTSIGGVDADICTNIDKIYEFFKTKNISVKQNLNLGQLQGELFDICVEKKLINPTFITDYPVQISPLARRHDNDNNTTQRFELFIAGSEIANAFSELNDPLDQLDRFAQQQVSKEQGDDEAHGMDEEFVEALSYGMAPTAGQGIGIDRLVMLLTNSQSIRDVILFPAMKIKEKQTSV